MSATEPINALDATSSQDAGAELDYSIDGDGVCANIGPEGRRARLRLAIIFLAIGLALLAVLIVAGVSRLWRLPLFVFFWCASISYFEWRGKTCVAYARANSRKLGDKLEKIVNPFELALVQGQSHQVLIKGTIAGAVMTLIALLLPVG